MFNRLQQKWKVGPLQLVLILCTFALGGSLSGYCGRWILSFLPLKGVVYLIIYIVLVTLFWPLSVLLVSIFFGQFRFFRQYLQKLGRRIGGGSDQKTLFLLCMTCMNLGL